MKDLHPEFIFDSNQNKKSVVLSIDEWNDVLLAIEELDDIKLYDKVKNDRTDKVISFSHAIQEIEENER